MRARSKPDAWASFRQTLFRFETGNLTPALALRNTAGVALPLLAGVALGNIPAGLATGTGALNVAFSDSQEPYPQRGRRMLAASVLVGFAVFVGALCGRNTITAVIVATAWAFGAGLLVALSTAAADIGGISLVTLVVYMAVPQPLDRAIYAGLLAFAGGLLQTLLAVALWPLRRYMVERRALADLYHELARIAAAPIHATAAPPASAQSTAAQTSLATLTRDHSLQAERYRALLSQAERTRLNLMMLGRDRIRIDREGGSEAAIIDRYCEAAARVLASIAKSLQAGDQAASDPESLRELDDLAEKLRALDPALSPALEALVLDARSQMDALTGQLRSAIELAAHASPAGLEEFERREAAKPWRLRLAGTWATLRANLSLDSAAFRHALRLAACIAIGTALARSFELRRAYWVPMTIAIVLKPDFTATFTRGILRLAGTALGLILATGMFHALPQTPYVEVALIAALMFLMRYIGPANYGVFVIAVTALVVVLIAMTGVAPHPVMSARFLNTALGGVIALLAYWLWPTWERTQVPEAIARMLDAYRNYFRAIRLSYENPATSFETERDRERLPGRLARSNVEASIDRLSAEPGTSAETVSLLSGILASSHRMVHAMMALEAGLYSGQTASLPAAFKSFADDVELTLYYLAAALRGSQTTHENLPDLRERHHALGHSRDALIVETDRITNSLNTLSAELLRWLHPNLAAPAPH